MEVIVIESPAFYRLIAEVERFVIQQHQADSWLTDAEAMSLFKIRSKSHWSTFKSKHGLCIY